MGLDLNKLQQVRQLSGGDVQARCPACAKDGGDKSGNHLRVYSDGRFGCCVHPGDREHRKTIFALAGDQAPRSFKIRSAPSILQAAPVSIKAELLAHGMAPSQATPQPQSTALSESMSPRTDFGTVGTGNSKLRAYAEGETENNNKDLARTVPTVPAVPTQPKVKMPLLTTDGTLVIPFDSPERYHWWTGGQTVTETLTQLRAQEAQANPT